MNKDEGVDEANRPRVTGLSKQARHFPPQAGRREGNTIIRRPIELLPTPE